VSPVVARSVSTGLLAALWAFLVIGPFHSLVLWAAFISWACVLNNGRDTHALTGTIVGNGYGILLAWIALVLIYQVPVPPLGIAWPILAVGITGFLLAIVITTDLLSLLPASIYGYAAFLAYAMQQPVAGKLLAISLSNPLASLGVSMFSGALLGYVSSYLEKAVTNNQSPPTPASDPVDLPAQAKAWAIVVDGKDLNYGQVHDMIHRDIALGNDYRKERIKLLTALATGVFALTVTFHKDLFGSATLTSSGLALMLLGWLMLLLSLLAGILHFRKWEDYYLEHRAVGNAVWQYRTAVESDKPSAVAKFNQAQRNIRELQQSYRKWNIIQSAGLLAGLALIAAYVVSSGLTVISKAPSTGTTTVKPETK
jgi:hypothetical protein